ncbi:hypothetical protein EOPP23_05585 [Endozoicomonas sp. OPT23]|uniref:DUF3604 domain-containing protein n=1 Tax=Endozoicomonas sp. OPT23 TaxID=2072845 RepID=UPI00129B0A42|nr:DUF3604 domain-containing protein [Endozoicomonas sp. OPT23]MRI32456.1 hypothetical protein [Endozoicomonas sp. OPT23]
MWKIIKWGLIVIASLVLLIAGAGWLVGSGILYDLPEDKKPIAEERSVKAVNAVTIPAAISSAATSSTAASSTEKNKEILFGDLHVHTSYSLDAAIFDTPAVKDTSYKTPVDACDYSRYCSGLDFWSINDHAEGMTPWQWDATKQAIRDCQSSTDPLSPDMVSFLGWEWTQGSTNPDPEKHYGHKNVMFRDIEEGKVPSRPISANPEHIARKASQFPAAVRGLALLAMSKLDMEGYESLAKHLSTLADTDNCAEGRSPELPSNCYETAETAKELFEKLDQWNMDAMVIPHGLAWGYTNPQGADFNYQMDELSDKYQRLLEVNSGHGNSEVYRDLPLTEAGANVCGAPVDGYTPCCWQAGEIIRDRCEANGNDTATCDQRAADTRELYLASFDPVGPLNYGYSVVPDSKPDEWGTCDQLVGEFQPASGYQPKQSAQYILTLGDESNRFRPGFIGSSDTHSGRAGNGFKEKGRVGVTDVQESAAARKTEKAFSTIDIPQKANGGMLSDKEDRNGSFYFTSGMVAVHSEAKDRDSIWDALYRKEVYGTSGPRISLWFDMMDDKDKTYPMGSEVYTSSNPTFKIKAMGSIKQKPGCPDYAVEALGADRIENLCLGECFNPGNEAYDITRIEIIKVLPRISEDEKASDLILDPWKVVECQPGQSSCEAEFTDPDFQKNGREAAYYARAVQEATPTIQGDPMGCEYNEAGECVKTNYCLGNGDTDDCISDVEHRAWSSPVYLMPVKK